MDKKAYITEEEREKCRRVADAFAEMEDVDVVVVDVGRYGFVKLQYYTPPTGFENDFTFTDSQASCWNQPCRWHDENYPV